MTRLEIDRVLDIVQRIEQGAFVFAYPPADVKGGVLKKPSHP